MYIVVPSMWGFLTSHAWSATLVCVCCVCSLASPRLVRLYQATQLKVGSQFKLVCQIDCSPIASCSVIWYFKGVIIDPEKDHKYEISSDGLLHNLTLEEPGREDLGQYACVLKSQFGTTEDSQTITVTLPGM